jgi:LysR family nitrogen assimilation transcriptional regulator
MDLRSISYFVKIANVGSITGAAEQLGVAQSALSRHVRSVEDELGMPLLVRGPRGVRLTGAGLQFLERCQRVIREITLAKEELRMRKEVVPRGNVVLGISPTIGPLLLPGSIERAQQQCPEVFLRVVEGYSPALFDALLTGKIDLAVMMSPLVTRALTLRPLVSEPIVVLTPPQPRNARRFFTLAELAKTPLIVTAAAREIIEEQLRRIDAKPIIQIEVGAIEPIRRLLLRGIGVTALPVSTFRDDIVAGRIAAYPIADGDFHRMLYLAHSAERPPSAAMAEISQILVAETNVLIELGTFEIPIFRQIKDQTKRPMSELKPIRKHKR